MTQATKRKLMTLGAFAIGIVLIIAVFVGKPKPQRQPAEVVPPAVHIVEAKPSSIQITVDAQGTVTPKREIDLVPEVAGKVVDVAETFIAGGFFNKGDVLIRVEPRDYEFAVTRAEAELASAVQRLALEQAEADQARRDWSQLGETGEPTPLVLREPQLAEARARLAAAQAQLDDAKLDLERTVIRAPFAGRVREKRVDIGQYVTLGVALGRVYSTDVVEIRLPLTDRQIGYLGLPLSPNQDVPPVNVTLSARFAGDVHHWSGQIFRTEGAIDPRSRVLYAVVEVADPFGLKAEGKKSVPLSVGLFVEAEIEGKTYEDVFVLPRQALKEQDQLIIVNDEDKLEFRTVGVLQSNPDTAFINAGLKSGDRVMWSTLENPVDGMAVEVLESDVQLNAAASSLGGGRP
ncbi:MAG: efflux RND transporter periplasmic adaptor subunit [Sphingomonadales bacterium]|jgi:RND family efflux transporter MFP subunit